MAGRHQDSGLAAAAADIPGPGMLLMLLPTPVVYYQMYYTVLGSSSEQLMRRVVQVQLRLQKRW
jgi:hypothetical protein